MGKYFIAACLAATALVPASAIAQQSCERQRSNRVVATAGGAVVGGVAGNVIAGHGDKTLGTVIGAVLGGVIGNQVAKPNADWVAMAHSGRWTMTWLRNRVRFCCED